MSDHFWERAAQTDPLWAILSDPMKKNRQWDVAQFFETGEREISVLLHQLLTLGHYPRTGRAFDFGCGVGRLTQALASTFREVVGIDISPTMIRLAGELNQHGDRVTYLLNPSDSLASFASESFDFVYSDIVLQHVRPELARLYVAEFIRVLRPNGITVFQLPSHRRTPASEAPRPTHMTKDAYRAGVRLLRVPPGRMSVGDHAVVVVQVTNESGIVWNQDIVGPLNVGNHWRGAGGEMLVQDDARAPLPRMFKPGESARVTLDIKAPLTSGATVCEVDVVHEGISWFADLGSVTVHASVIVRGRDETSDVHPLGALGSERRLPRFANIYESLPLNADAEISSFPMHGVPQAEVLALLRRCGADAFFIEVDERGGPEWHGYRYFVRRTS